MATLALLPAHDPQIEQVWRRLELAATPAYELTWGYVEAWLAGLARCAAPLAGVLYDGTTPIAACIFDRDHVLAIHALVCAPAATRALPALIEQLPGDWEECVLPAIDRADLAALAPLGDRYRLCIDREVAVPIVDLDAVRATRGGYPALAPPTVRAQLLAAERSLALAVDVAADRDAALAIYGELCARRGVQPPWDEALDRRLIATRLPHGEIELVRVTDAGTIIGCLMCVAGHGRVACWREGVPDPLAGHLCHAAAIAHAAARGMTSYELAAQQLATSTRRRVWLRVQPKLVARRGKRVPSVVRA
jgi:hypothetical protein